MAAGEIGALFRISGPSISRHLSVLKAAALVRERREGNRIIYKLEQENLATHLGDFLSAVCPTQILQRKKIRRRKGTSSVKIAITAGRDLWGGTWRGPLAGEGHEVLLIARGPTIAMRACATWRE